MEEAFRAPCRGLVPGEVAESLAADGLGDGASFSLSREEDAPALSDRIVTVGGGAEEQERTLRWVLERLCEVDPSCLFVAVVPCSAAGAVVGTRGQRVQTLIKRSGAQIDVKREVLEGLSLQPVIVRGTLEQVLVGTLGVVEVMQELADRGRLGPADFALPSRGAVPEVVEGQSGACPSSGSSLRAQAAPAQACLPPAPVVLVLDMGIVGYVIGKQGRRAAEIQNATGARINLAAKGGSLPGMRCGDRLLEISAEGEEQREQGLRAVLAAVAEAPSDGGVKPGASGPLTVLVPLGAVGYIIGKGGQTLREITSQCGVSMEIQQEQPPIAGARTATISGPPDRRAAAMLAIVGKVDELRARQADGASVAAGTVAPLPAQRSPSYLAAASPAPPARAAAAPPEDPAVAFAAALGPGTIEGTADPTASWAARTPAEKALLAGIQASGVFNHQLSVCVPEGLLTDLDVAEVARKSGARLEVGGPGADGAGPGHCFVTVVGQRVSTSLAALFLQEKMARS